MEVLHYSDRYTTSRNSFTELLPHQLNINLNIATLYLEFESSSIVQVPTLLLSTVTQQKSALIYSWVRLSTSADFCWVTVSK